MSSVVELLRQTPRWVLRPLPSNAVVQAEALDRVLGWGESLPHLKPLALTANLLGESRFRRDYDALCNVANACVWRSRDALLSAPDFNVRLLLAKYARDHMLPGAQAQLLRRLAKDPHVFVRATTGRIIRQVRLREVALPADDDSPWDTSGWQAGVEPQRVRRHVGGTALQQRNGVPPLATLVELRRLLGIRSATQLGYLLVASDAGRGPYKSFTIPKRDGGQRTICAPKRELRWVQSQILRKILDQLPVHPAAHGFVTGRSTVTNARVHQRASTLVKFDLLNFFPTIHYYRVAGLFASLGYTLDDGRFGTEDESRRIAPTLARLCTYTQDPTAWGGGVLPQGAPTSPAISNLVCRGLDARLTGLAEESGGRYTRYADDLTISFPGDAPNLGRFRWWVDQICHQEGFFVNQAKFRVIRSSQRQTVTGIVVNDELRLSRSERRRLRAILHNCRKQGIETQARGNPGFVAWLRGYASYLHMVHPTEGRAALTAIDELTRHSGGGR